MGYLSYSIHCQISLQKKIKICFWLKDRRNVHNIFSNLFFQSPRYEEFFRNNSKIYTVRMLPLKYSSSSTIVVWIRRLTLNGEIVGSIPTILLYIFSKKALCYAILHLYLQQPGIMKIFLLCNIPGKVLLFFLNKHDIMWVNCMQNVTKNYNYII